MAICSAVLATDVKHSVVPEEWYWSEKLLLRGSTESSVPALGFYKQRAPGLQTEGLTASVSTEPSLKPKPKSAEHSFQKKTVPSFLQSSEPLSNPIYGKPPQNKNYL